MAAISSVHFPRSYFAILHILQHAWHGCNFVMESGGGGVFAHLKPGDKKQKQVCHAIFLGTCLPKKQHVKRSQLRIIKLGSKSLGGGQNTVCPPGVKKWGRGEQCPAPVRGRPLDIQVGGLGRILK